MLQLSVSGVSSMVAVGAHCDDIAIGAGATLLQLAAAGTLRRVDVLVASGGGSPREQEERAALRAFLPGVELAVTVLALPDGRLPEHRAVVKDALQRLAAETAPDLVLGPQRDDAHQDHRLLAEMVPTAFRDHLVLGYEILKWESDLPRVQAYVPVDADTARRKSDLLHAHYGSQTGHDWFDPEAFLGLLRIRGAQCHHRYAEGFVTEKLTLGFD